MQGPLLYLPFVPGARRAHEAAVRPRILCDGALVARRALVEPVPGERARGAELTLTANRCGPGAALDAGGRGVKVVVGGACLAVRARGDDAAARVGAVRAQRARSGRVAVHVGATGRAFRADQGTLRRVCSWAQRVI